jgi:hypothetical protein
MMADKTVLSFDDDLLSSLPIFFMFSHTHVFATTVGQVVVDQERS